MVEILSNNKFGRKWICGVAARSKEKVRLAEESVIPGRSEQVVTVRCTSFHSLRESDFIPVKLRGHHGVFVSKARVSPNMNGGFQVTVMNVTETDVKMYNRTVLGSLRKADSIICSMDQETAKQKV